MKMQKRGAVLIAVMALAALSAAIAMEVAYMTRIEGDRVRLEHDRLQAELMARAGYDLALETLARDDVEIDSLEDIWAKPLEFNRNEGFASVTITDESSLFPLHSLFDAAGLLNIGARDRFDRLLQSLNLPVSHSDKIIDYVDADNDPFPAGAEAEAYLAMTPARRPANTLLRSVDELAQIAGIDSVAATKLAEHVTLHSSGAINLNTADPHALVASCKKLSLDQADRITTRARFSRYAAVKEITDVATIDAQGLEELSAHVQIASSTYRIASSGRSGATEVLITTIVERQPDKFVIKYRRLE